MGTDRHGKRPFLSGPYAASVCNLVLIKPKRKKRRPPLSESADAVPKRKHVSLSGVDKGCSFTGIYTPCNLYGTTISFLILTNFVYFVNVLSLAYGLSVAERVSYDSGYTVIQCFSKYRCICMHIKLTLEMLVATHLLFFCWGGGEGGVGGAYFYTSHQGTNN